MTTQSSESGMQVWIGLVGLTGERTNPILDGCRGAYSTFLVFANSHRTFKDAAEKGSYRKAPNTSAIPTTVRITNPVIRRLTII